MRNSKNFRAYITGRHRQPCRPMRFNHHNLNTMNYLAHLYLAEDTDESRLGNLLGDFVKGPVADSPYSPGIKEGIKTHRKVDIYTDSHRKFLESKKLISSERRRFAGIILDLTFDHFLAKNWKAYSDSELGSFTQDVYEMLRNNTALLPAKLVSFLPRMIQEDWLGSYEKLERVSIVIERISWRLERKFKRKNTLRGASGEIEANYGELERNFKEFFPDLIGFVENYRSTTSDQSQDLVSPDPPPCSQPYPPDHC